ncbi:MAG: cytochrome c family protein, partial [Desulfacinum sp.]|nr:cytochrome c family protein [Desulfacinum sp.]
MLKRFLVIATTSTLVCWGGAALHAQDASKSYVGNETCAQCHEAEYRRFTEYSKKHHSFQSIEKLQDGLTPQELQQCYACHTTGFGQPGGF